MSFLSRLKYVADADKERAIKELVEDSTPDFDFFFMMTLSVLMATLGLLLGSETIVIGSMLIAPLLHPILSLALGISMSDQNFMRRSTRTIAKAIGISVGASILATIFFDFGSFESGMNSIILLRTEPSLGFLLVAIISGFAVVYALVKPKLSETLPGVAVSVALLPPLAVIGIGLAELNFAVAVGATVMFLINVIGIVAAAMFAFSLMNVHESRNLAAKVVEREKERVEREKEKIEEAEHDAEEEEEADQSEEEGGDTKVH